MGTRSAIGLQLKDGSIKGIYCHWDGYPSHNGRLLKEFYNTEEKVKELIDLGNISSLDESIEKPAGHTFNNKVKGYTAFYGRDRGEKDQKAKLYRDLKDFQRENDFASWLYVFKPEENQWYYMSYDGKTLSVLTDDAIKDDKEEGGSLETEYKQGEEEYAEGGKSGVLMNLENYVAEKVDEGVDIIFTEVHAVVKTKSGDIAPEQVFRLEKIKKDLSELIVEQVNQNLEEGDDSMATGGTLGGYKPYYLLFKSSNEGTIRLFEESYHKGSGDYSAIGDIVLYNYEGKHKVSRYEVSSDKSDSFRKMAKVIDYIDSKKDSHSVDAIEVLQILGGKELIVANVGVYTQILPKNEIGYKKYDVVYKKDGTGYTHIYASNMVDAMKKLKSKIQNTDTSIYDVVETDVVVSDSRGDIVFAEGGKFGGENYHTKKYSFRDLF